MIAEALLSNRRSANPISALTTSRLPLLERAQLDAHADLQLLELKLSKLASRFEHPHPSLHCSAPKSLKKAAYQWCAPTSKLETLWTTWRESWASGRARGRCEPAGTICWY